MANINNMTISNNKAQEIDGGVFTYESNGEKVKLSKSMIKKYLVSGGGEVSDEEVTMFLNLCYYQHLNPFLREAYLIKYGNNSPATMVGGKELFTKRAMKNPRYEGKQAGVTIISGSGEIIEREGAAVYPGEQLIGGWAKVYIKGYQHPEYAAVSLEEYIGRKADGKPNNQWATKPATMIRKVALVHALREAFPDDYEGIYSPEEIPEANGIIDAAAFDIPKEIPDAITEAPADNKPETMDDPF